MPRANEVIDIDDAGDVRRRYERCRCFTWAGPDWWAEQALLADRRGDVVHHPSCELSLAGDVDAQGGKSLRDALKPLQGLVDSAVALANALRGVAPFVAGAWVVSQLAGPVGSYAAARAGASHGRRRRRRKGRR
jgi:hypothetical protein